MDAAPRTCRICEQRDFHPEHTVREMMFGTRAPFKYFQCNRCGCLQIDEIPSDLGRFYPEDYYSFQFDPATDGRSWIYRWLQKQRCRTAIFGVGRRLDLLIRHFVSLPEAQFTRSAGLPTGKVLKKAKIDSFSARFLDVGCGSYSRWLDDLQQLGFRHLAGVDPFIRFDKNHGRVRIVKRELKDIKGEFDLISFNHSLEHMPDQVEALRNARNLLSANGVCLVRIPIVSSFVWEKYGVNWVEIDAPRHLYLHSVDSITQIATRAGLDLVSIEYDSVPFEFYGSEQYARDIALNDPRSLSVNPESSLFSRQEKEEFRTMASRANEAETGGRAGFYFRKIQFGAMGNGTQ